MELAKSMMVIMVRGLFTKLQFAYAQFPCASVCGYHLYDIFWEAVQRLERCGFKVMACTCDGLSVNRNFFKLHNKEKSVHKVRNPYSEEKRYIFFMSDPPHLIKTTRNCWNSTKRLMWVRQHRLNLSNAIFPCKLLSLKTSTLNGGTCWHCTTSVGHV